MTDTIKCQYCGTAIPVDADTCIMCGSPAKPATPPPAPQPAAPPAPEVIEPEIVEPEAVLPPSLEPLEVPSKASTSPSTRLLAVAIEVLAGLVGFLGIGWIIAGKLVTGIVLLIGYWFFLLGYLVFLFRQIDPTNGWSLLGCCVVPIFPLLSGLVLHFRTK